MKIVTCRQAYGAFLTVISLIISIGGCAVDSRVWESTLDTPEHHVFTGMKLMDNGKLSDAEREFNLAKKLDNTYAPMYQGLGLVYAYKGAFKAAFTNILQAKKLAKTKDEEARVYMGLMRLYTQQKGDDWLHKVEDNFNQVKEILHEIGRDWPDPYFYMGLAFKEAYKFRYAAEQFKKVLQLNTTSFADKANHELELVEKIKIAMPETTIGKKIVLLEKVKRVDAAALFIQEMKLDEVYEKIRPKPSDTSSPLTGQDSSLYHVPVPPDAVDHPRRGDIQTIIGLQIKGLRTLPNGYFDLNEYITRASYAMMIADIISTVSHDPALKTMYIGCISPFADVGSNVSYFNAVMVCTTRGIMGTEEGFSQNLFDPMGSVSGVDALLIIRRTQEHLKIL
jgi:tetratricopeptide (TPR) repeat protein